ncbi:putative quinol monooxygenase [Flavobacterium sp. HSC-61S13]|uniref:putative quinol monooxygenase n=1 Tax=Flavobacterium sp. HSC-61S13 TaxID=2910963 RepID=UPI0020A20759|nr:putative quinol monooxygenase [Flavobacterium sp. HSC-61S13]MCP1997361.1 quinol monooxygenase YgiN [Flavobacterium sp. HSC-61S13]
MSIYLTAIIQVKPEHQSAVSILLQKMVTETRKEIACIQYDLHQGVKDPNTFVFYEIWKDQIGLDAHNQQEYIKEFNRFAERKLQQQPQLFLTDKIEIPTLL